MTLPLSSDLPNIHAHICVHTHTHTHTHLHTYHVNSCPYAKQLPPAWNVLYTSSQTLLFPQTLETFPDCHGYPNLPLLWILIRLSAQVSHGVAWSEFLRYSVFNLPQPRRPSRTWPLFTSMTISPTTTLPLVLLSLFQPPGPSFYFFFKYSVPIPAS